MFALAGGPGGRSRARERARPAALPRGPPMHRPHRAPLHPWRPEPSWEGAALDEEEREEAHRYTEVAGVLCTVCRLTLEAMLI